MDNTSKLEQEIKELKQSINELKSEIRNIKAEKKSTKFDIGDNLWFVAMFLFIAVITYINH